jgi:hypothetical protein
MGSIGIAEILILGIVGLGAVVILIAAVIVYSSNRKQNQD